MEPNNYEKDSIWQNLGEVRNSLNHMIEGTATSEEAFTKLRNLDIIEHALNVYSSVLGENIEQIAASSKELKDNTIYVKVGNRMIPVDECPDNAEVSNEPKGYGTTSTTYPPERPTKTSGEKDIKTRLIEIRYALNHAIQSSEEQDVYMEASIALDNLGVIERELETRKSDADRLSVQCEGLMGRCDSMETVIQSLIFYIDNL